MRGGRARCGPQLRRLALLGCACCGCTGFDQLVDAGLDAAQPADARATEGRMVDAGERPDLRPADARRGDAAVGDAAPLPGAACRPFALACLDAADPALHDVPGEGTLADAFAAATAGQTVQVRGLTLGAGWWIPPHVTLRGCAGARIKGNIAFKGDGGAIEGFVVEGRVVANRSGAFVIRRNRFVADGSSEAAVSARSDDGLVAAAVTAVVDANLFQRRARGVEALTRYDTLTHAVTLTLSNNVFTHVDKPIVISEGGLVGKISARIEHNTLHVFETGLTLVSLSEVLAIAGTLLAEGQLGVSADAAYEVRGSATWNVQIPHSLPPLAGAFASGDPQLVDAAAGDFRLASSSPLVDRVPASPTMPVEDFAGCPRPVALLGGAALGDVGALETQPR